MNGMPETSTQESEKYQVVVALVNKRTGKWLRDTTTDQENHRANLIYNLVSKKFSDSVSKENEVLERELRGY